MNVDVIVPVYKPDHKFECLLRMLVQQTKQPSNIIVLNTEILPEYSTSAIKQRIEKAVKDMQIPGTGEINIEVHSIKKQNFDHGGTRKYGASLCKSNYFLCMTQDAVPKDNKLIEKLLEPFSDGSVAAAYGRQLADESAGIIETYTRIFNYPEIGSVKSKEDKKRLGIKTYFCSNVCAIYRRDCYEEVGGFVEKTIFNEDMILASKLIEKGYRIAYAADAKVIHSHNYSASEQFHRNFDLGVSHLEFKEIFSSVPSESEGIKLVKRTISYLADQKEYLAIIDFIVQSAAKYFGYFMGKHYIYLPMKLVRACSMNKGYWRL